MKENKNEVRIASGVTREVKDQIDQFCKEHRVTVSWLIREAILEYMENHK